MSYFDSCTTVEIAKAEYRRLAMQNHPDKGGSTATMQDINSQYHAILQKLDGQTSFDNDNREHTYKYSRAVEQSIIDKIAELVGAGIASTCEIFLIGTWVWITGNTKPVKELLKQAGCKWHSKRLCWYWQNDGYKHRYNGKSDLGALAAKYGAAKFGEQEKSFALA